MSSLRRICIPSIYFAILWSHGVVNAQTPSQESAKAFVDKYCVACHSVDNPNGEREFETLDLSSDHFDTQLKLQEIIDQLTLGAMPPEDGDQPDTEERLKSITQLTSVLSGMRQRSTSTGGPDGSATIESP